MFEFIVHTAKHMPESVIVDNIEKSLRVYRQTKKKDDYESFQTWCMFLTLKHAIGDENVEMLLKNFKMSQQVMESFKNLN